MTGTPSTPTPDLIIIGASARAACFSAARAGFAPYWIDQFGDADLRAAFPGTVVPASAYPAGIVATLDQAPAAPVIYTGALENHARVLERIAARRPLMGNSAAACARVRDPVPFRDCLAAHELDYPRILPAGATVPVAGRWLLKPLRSGGGLGIGVAQPGTRATPGHYLQEFVLGESFSAVYVAMEDSVRLLGITRQLVGEAEFHAPAFCYCGSIGPVTPTARIQRQWVKIGSVLARVFGLRGVFGVDAVVYKGRLTLIEVNPRYTASVEVLEAALGIAVLELHMEAWGQVLQDRSQSVRSDPRLYHGKACLFAPFDLAFNHATADWCRNPPGGRCADLPVPGTPINRGAPILTVLCCADSLESCAGLLRRAAAGVYQALGVAD